MRVHWWQSIRWRLALGSVLLAVLATSSLALIAIVIVNNSYGQDQQKSLEQFANQQAHSIAVLYNQMRTTVRNPPQRLAQAATEAVSNLSTDQNSTQGQDQAVQVIVFGRDGTPLYPPLNAGATTTSATVAQNNAAIQQLSTDTLAAMPTPSVLPFQATQTAVAKVVANAKAAASTRSKRNAILYTALRLVNPSIQPDDLNKFRTAIERALKSPYTSTDNEFGRDGPIGNVQPFSVRPIFVTRYQIAGALVVTRPTSRLPAFVTTVGVAVFIASLIIAVIAALVAILFSQTLMGPLARLTGATRIIASGNYDAQVTTKAPGELGELAQNFNEMARQLKRDMEDLRRQEVWRRELIMNITHDLATPLTAIAGLGESLMDGVNQNREDYEVTGRVIMRETLRLRRLVQDLHVMAKVEAGALQPSLKPLRLAALVDETLAVLAPEFERHQVEPNNMVPFQLPLIQADADMLIRVFSNLCNNALRHTPPGGMVTINATLRDAATLQVDVTDTGEGIPAHSLTRIFERFYRADNSRQSSTGGSGLGLAIVQAIVEAHGGKIWASNVAGGGACISFTLPIPPAAQVHLADVATIPVMRKGPRSTHLTRMEPEH